MSLLACFVVCSIDTQIELSRNGYEIVSCPGGDGVWVIAWKGIWSPSVFCFPFDSSKYCRPTLFCTELDGEALIMGKQGPIIFFPLQNDRDRIIRLSFPHVLSCVAITLQFLIACIYSEKTLTSCYPSWRKTAHLNPYDICVCKRHWQKQQKEILDYNVAGYSARQEECKSVYRCSTRPHSKVGVKPADIQRSEMQAAAVHMKSDTSSEEQKKRA